MSRKAMEAKKSAPRVQADSMRLDKYLKVSRIIKRRSVANDACSTGHITVNGKEAKRARTCAWAMCWACALAKSTPNTRCCPSASMPSSRTRRTCTA